MTPGPMPAFPEDLTIARRALAGDDRARHEFAERMRCVGRIVGALNERLSQRLSPQDLEDLIQEIAFAVWRSLPEYAGAAPLEGYARAFCELSLRNALRGRLRRQAAMPLDDHVAPIKIDAVAEADALHRCLERVEPESRTILRMKYVDGMTLEAIARTLGKNINTVKSTHSRALLRLQAFLEPTSRQQ